MELYFGISTTPLFGLGKPNYYYKLPQRKSRKLRKLSSRQRDYLPLMPPFGWTMGFSILDSAGSNFLKASTLEPNAPLPLFALGVVSLRKNVKGKAKEYFQKSLDLLRRYDKIRDQSPYSEYLFSVNEEDLKNRISLLL